jgi:hypothetical protein
MSNSIHSLQAENVQAQTEQTVQPLKKLQIATQTAIPQDKVTLSKASQKAHAGSTQAAVGGDKDHDGDSA